MRIIGTLHSPIDAQRFSAFLQKKGIPHQIEVEANTDWSNPEYGDRMYKIWIQEEDQTEQAMEWYETFVANPNDPMFPGDTPRVLPKVIPTVQSQSVKTKIVLGGAIPWEKQPMGIVTRYMLIICCSLFFIGQYLLPPLPANAPKIAYNSLLRSPVDKELMYDYPHAYDILDKIIKLYGADKLQDPTDLPSEGQYLLKQFYQTPYWKGLYEMVIDNAHLPLQDWKINEPLFEKIREGEVWRLVTPIFLHADIFHLFFNMLWLLVLGKQIEQRIGPWKTLLFIVVTGVFSNTAQYLMSGSNFLGFSGVLCAMLMFIWIRQQKAPWEGYQLQRATMGFMMVFILGMAAIQLLSFIFELTMKMSLTPGIANTAHMSGLVIGGILGKIDFFGWKQEKVV